MQTPIPPAPTAPILLIPIHRLVHDPGAPRRSFRERPLRNLTDNIARRGLLHPLVVRPSGSQFIVVDGERRRRAAQRLHLPELPCIVIQREWPDLRAAQISENILRQRLLPLEQSLAIRKIHDALHANDPSTGWKEVAQRVGLERTRTIHLRQLSSLPAPILNMLRDRLLSAEHGAELSRLQTHPEKQLALAHAACRRPGRRRYGLSRYQLRQKVAAILNPSQTVAPNSTRTSTGGESNPTSIHSAETISQALYNYTLLTTSSSFKDSLAAISPQIAPPALRALLRHLHREINFVLGPSPPSTPANITGTDPTTPDSAISRT